MKTRLRDGTLNPFSPYRWENCVQKLSVEALSNAESLAYVGLMATFARLTRQHMETSAITGGYTLERVPQDMDDVDAIAAHEESLSNGHLFFYHDITTTGVPGSPNADS